jgi:hypothetical protein
VGSIPLLATQLQNQQPPSPMDQYSKVMALKSMMGQQQVQQSELQNQALQRQSTQQDIDLKQIGINNAKITNSALTDPNMMDDFKSWQSSKGSSPSQSPQPQAAAPQGSASPMPNAAAASQASSGGIQLNPLAQYLVEKKGLPLMGPGGALEMSNNLTKGQQDLATLLKTQGDTAATALKNHSEQRDNFNDLVEPIVSEAKSANPDQNKIQQGIQALQQELQQHPELYPAAAVQHAQTMTTLPGVITAANTAKLNEMVTDEAQKAAGAQKTKLEIAPPTKDQINTFVSKTLPSFSTMTPAQRASFTQQAQQARTVDEFNKVVQTADSTDKAMQLHLDTMANTRAIQGNKFGEAGLTANEKIWTDPQRGYAAAVAQANQTKQSIKAGADGNALITNLVPTMEVLGVNHAAGINRISPTEASAAALSPDWATRWNAFATKAMTGKLTPELAKEGNQLMDIVTDAAYNRAVQSSQFIAKGHGMTDLSQVPAMAKDGSVTTLDKVARGGGGSKPSGNNATSDPFTPFGGKAHPNQ